MGTDLRGKGQEKPDAILDNPQLLKLMLEDTANAPDIYKPTNYWSVHEKKFLPELQEFGLHDFRRRKNSILASFGATDLATSNSHIDLLKSGIFNNRIASKIPFWSNFLSLQNYLLNKILPISTPYNMTVDDLMQLAYAFTRIQGERAKAKSLDEFEASLVGNPEDIFKINEKFYTMGLLYYYLRYAYCCNHMDFNNIKVMVELGSGSGKQIEVLKKLHPDICFLLFDIPPQLYVCEQYLSAVFPNSVVSYQETRNMETIPIQKGKIFIFGNWKFPIIEQLKVDLFWNAASFQEMEPEVVANYLTYVNKIANAVFLQEIMKGKEVADKKGNHGVLKQTKLEDYQNGLTNFTLSDMSLCLSPFGNLKSQKSGYRDSFWKRMQQ